MKALSLALALLAVAGAARAAPALTEADVRAFAQRQERAWNAGDLAAYFALFTPDARFTDQARTPGGKVVPYGSSTVAEARAQARRFRAASQVRETGQVTRVVIAADGASARVSARQVSRLTTPARTRRICAERTQVVVATAAGLRSRGQTDTIIRCPR